MPDTAKLVLDAVTAARTAARRVARLGASAKNDALFSLADVLKSEESAILEANHLDLKEAETGGLEAAFVDRLRLTPQRIEQMADGVRQIAILPDPVGRMGDFHTRPNGMQVGRMRVPLGVVGFIYESRPNVTVDAAALCLKSGNAVVLKGGSEAMHSNRALANAIRRNLEKAGVPADAVGLLDTSDRDAVTALATADEYVDVIIPRGGEGLIRAVARSATVPVIKHYKGVCHVYVDEFADLEMALNIAFNSKVQRPGVCNAMETLLVHEAVAKAFLSPFGSACRETDVELRGCEKTGRLLPGCLVATEKDYQAEFLALILAVKVVETFDEALDHIEHYGSRHTEAIVTRDWDRARRFLAEVDSSSVMVNASTRFSDGFEYGLGAEIGISTDKLHARGPMGLESLTCEKWVVLGSGQLRENFGMPRVR